ncbi:DNA topoisomerase type I [Aureococcus anophagefferens]|nr:DNA topoisomerase type I [Aureococcus anophagefferens]
MALSPPVHVRVSNLPWTTSVASVEASLRTACDRVNIAPHGIEVKGVDRRRKRDAQKQHGGSARLSFAEETTRACVAALDGRAVVGADRQRCVVEPPAGGAARRRGRRRRAGAARGGEAARGRPKRARRRELVDRFSSVAERASRGSGRLGGDARGRDPARGRLRARARREAPRRRGLWGRAAGAPRGLRAAALRRRRRRHGNLAVPLGLWALDEVVAVDINGETLRLLEARAGANVRALEADAAALTVRDTDCVVSLHACGAVSDLAMDAALDAQIPFAISPCCLGKSLTDRAVVGGRMPRTSAQRAARPSNVEYPRSRWLASELEDASEWGVLAAAADYGVGADDDADVARVQRRAKRVVETDRLAYAAGLPARNAPQHASNAMDIVMCVAEKPSIADAIAKALAKSTVSTRGGSPRTHEFRGRFGGASCEYRVTSVLGHCFNLDFAPANGNVLRNLRETAKDCDALVLFLDCDREGEAIAFQVMDVTQSELRPGATVHRAKFSAVTPADIEKAMATLGEPDERLSEAVIARQELDLRVGVAFTRFTTRHFQSKYAGLDARTLSYGPCQTPTLGFVVRREDEIATFEPEPYWFPDAALEVDGAADATWARAGASTGARERVLRLSPAMAMKHAEHLYLDGFLSYPRTETNKFPPSMDLRAAIDQQAGDARWRAPRIFGAERVAAAKRGLDAGDHPPITPTAPAPPGVLNGKAAALYDLVTRRFLASVSEDAAYADQRVAVDLAGERFVVERRALVAPAAGGRRVAGEMRGAREAATRPPERLSEADCVALMEKHGIGTDASIPSHIENVCKRSYVAVDGKSRRLRPTELGGRLPGLLRVDASLVLPEVRAAIEAACDLIAGGEAPREAVVAHCVANFAAKYAHLAAHVDAMEQLFDAVYAERPEDDASRSAFSRCGLTGHYLHLVPRPQRLYDPATKDVVDLPRPGSVAASNGRRCPACRSELLWYGLRDGAGDAAKTATYPLCGACYDAALRRDDDGGVGVGGDDGDGGAVGAGRARGARGAPGARAVLARAAGPARADARATHAPGRPPRLLSTRRPVFVAKFHASVAACRAVAGRAASSSS